MDPFIALPKTSFPIPFAALSKWGAAAFTPLDTIGSTTLLNKLPSPDPYCMRDPLNLDIP